MSNFDWGYPNTVWFGNGRIKDLPKACKVLDIKNPLFVTDKDLAKTKMVEDTLEINKRAKLPTVMFSDLKGNPLGSQVKKGVEVFKHGNHDGVIAFGGGSSLDVGKSIILQAALNRPLWDFTDGGSFWNENDYPESMAKNKISNLDNLKPFITVPTTAGTGSETSRAAAIINDETKVKKIVFHPRMLPTLTILDPKLTIGMPAFLTADSIKKAVDMVKLVGLEGRENYFPRELSGGQQQRVGIARSLAVEPDIWFLDEPFSALDPLIRKEMQDEFLRLQEKLKKTIMFITHDFDEALKLADRIAIMKDGIIEQLDTPAKIVLNPATEYVKKFTEEVPREKVLKIEDVMEKPNNENLGDLKVSKDEIIENVAEKILTQEKSVTVTGENNKIVGTVQPSKIIHTVFGGRRNNS